MMIIGTTKVRRRGGFIYFEPMETEGYGPSFLRVDGITAIVAHNGGVNVFHQNLPNCGAHFIPSTTVEAVWDAMSASVMAGSPFPGIHAKAGD